MGDFKANLSHLIQRWRPRKLVQIADEIGIGRSTLSRLKTGARPPSAQHLALIANYAGLSEAEQLLLPHEEFKKVVREGKATTGSPLHGLRIIAANLSECKKAEDVYGGQYVVYSPSTRPRKVAASLLEIGKTTSNGISVRIVDPYNGHEGEFVAFEYRGFLVPIADYVYIFAEQISGNYEVLMLTFHAVPVGRAQVLSGVQTGVGVIRGDRYIAAVSAVAQRVREPIKHWRDALGTRLGYLDFDSLPEVVRLKMGDRETILR